MTRQSYIVSRGRGKRAESGHAMVEVALLSPWIFILFAAVFDLGFYSYAVIATQNAARSAVMHTSRSASYVADLGGACEVARRELQGMPNVPASLTSCAASPGAITNALPIAVTVTGGPTSGLDGQPWARVEVTYRTPQMFPLPGMMGRLTVTRISEARVRDN